MRGSRTSIISIVAIGLLAGSSVGVTAQGEAAPQPPTPFNGVIDCGAPIQSGAAEVPVYELDEGRMMVQSLRGYSWRPTAREMSDPRFEGTYSISFDEDRYSGDALDGSYGTGAGTWRIENDEGAWQGSYHIFGTRDGRDTIVTVPLAGEGAYENLSAIVESAYDSNACRWEWRGLVVDGELPAYPKPPTE